MTRLNHHLIRTTLLNHTPKASYHHPTKSHRSTAITLPPPAAQETGRHLFIRVTQQFTHQLEALFLPPHLPSLMHGVSPDSDAVFQEVIITLVSHERWRGNDLRRYDSTKARAETEENTGWRMEKLWEPQCFKGV